MKYDTYTNEPAVKEVKSIHRNKRIRREKQKRT